MKYGKLTLIGKPYRRYPTEKSKHKSTYVLAKCICGSEKEYLVNNLKKYNHTTSCGCHRASIRFTHGLTKHPLNYVHRAMLQRCYNNKNRGYKNYGGRGISVCEEWKNSVKAFYDWSIVNGYQKGLQIDRRNNDGNYEPSNCRWVTPRINTYNSRQSKLTEQRAKHIRILCKYSNRTQKEIGVLYGVCQRTINRIARNAIWI